MAEGKNLLQSLERFKYPLLVLLLGLVILLLPSGKGQQAELPDGDALLQRVLSSSEGVGQAQVIVSENGVVVVCEGAENAKVRLDVIRAIGSYTGFTSDRITILKMAD